MSEAAFECQCGALGGVLKNATPKGGSKVFCHCVDCQAELHHLGQASMLDQWNGIALFQVDPSNIQITRGQEHLACMRLSPKGMLRWHTSCCNTPLFTSMTNPRILAAGFKTANLRTPVPDLGPLILRFKLDQAGCETSEIEDQRGSMLKAFWRVGRNSLVGLFTGAQKRNPVMHKGKPIVVPRVITLEEKRAAYAR